MSAVNDGEAELLKTTPTPHTLSERFLAQAETQTSGLQHQVDCGMMAGCQQLWVKD